MLLWQPHPELAWLCLPEEFPSMDGTAAMSNSTVVKVRRRARAFMPLGTERRT